MRNREVIEREIYRAREDLEESLAALKHAVQEKVNVKARARVAIERGKTRAHDGALAIYVKGRRIVRERPLLVGALIVGVIAALTLAYIWRRREQVVVFTSP